MPDKLISFLILFLFAVACDPAGKSELPDSSATNPDAAHDIVRAEECTVPFDDEEVHLVVGYKVCTSPMIPDVLGSFYADFMGEHSAFLYSDGTMVFAAEHPYWQGKLKQVTLDGEAWCEVMARLSLEWLLQELDSGHLSVFLGTDAESAVVRVQLEGESHEASIYGNPWWYVTRAPDTDEARSTLALLHGLDQLASGGVDFQPEESALLVVARSDDEFWPCPDSLAEWPFSDLDLAALAVSTSSSVNTTPTILNGELREQVRAWYDEHQVDRGICVQLEDGPVEVFLMDLPPGGYEAAPLRACSTFII